MANTDFNGDEAKITIGTNLSLTARRSAERLPDIFGIEYIPPTNPSETTPNEGGIVYILDAIQKNDISLFDTDPSGTIPTFSAVIEGTRMLLKKEDSTGRLYLSLDLTESMSNPNYTNILNTFSTATNPKIGGFVINGTPHDIVTIGGVPLAVNEDRKIILNDSGLSLPDVEEYSHVMWGGSPLTIGRIENNWYLIVTN